MTSSDLHALAALSGVATSYDDWSGRRVAVADDAVCAALVALGHVVDDDEAVRRALATARDRAWARALPPTVVVRGGPGQVLLTCTAGDDVGLEVVLEDGSLVAVPPAGVEQERDGERVRRLVPLPDLPTGYHRLRARTAGGQTEAALVVAPGRLAAPRQRSWGWMVQLYSLRSEDSWGLGDYGDLATVVASSAADGAGVVLVNPLHAETPVLPLDPSPYSPSSRLFRSVLHLRIDDVPELGPAPSPVREQVASLRPEREPDRIARDPAFAARLVALELLWPGHRTDAVAAFRAERGQPLEDLALFCALAEEHGAPWQDWPADLRHPDAAGVAAARERHAERIAFWCWAQLLVDEQLAAVARAAAPMAVGVVHDLAVGVAGGGADAWALQDALALGTTVGAPPDSFNQQGQDWGLPPWRPDRLAEQGYAPFRAMVQGVLRHAGGLRIDHVMGLFRLWWVPRGRPASEGTYVSYDADAMLAVLALEAERAGALVVGEDLGTVQDVVREALSGAGVLGSSVLWFAQDDDGAPVPPAQWPAASMASVTTHDLPTAAGFLAEEHVRVRHELGQLGVPVEQERERARTERVRLLEMLQAQGLLARAGGDPVLAMHEALVASPADVVLAAFGDAVGDLRQPNLPGTVDEYPNWRLPVADGAGRPLGLEELLASPGVRRLTEVLRGVDAARGSG